MNFNLKDFVKTAELKYLVDKIKNLISAKADLIHTHTLDDVYETSNKKIMTSDERKKINKIVIAGSGDRVLADNGSYVLNGSNIIDDVTLSNETTYSSSKIHSVVSSSIASSTHSHQNKTTLDGIHSDTTKPEYFLSEDGSYKIPAMDVLINDTVTESGKAWSSQKTAIELAGKSGVAHTHAGLNLAHTHPNKGVIDDITLDDMSKWNRLIGIIDPNKSGIGDKVFTDDLTFKPITDFTGIQKWGELKEKPFDSTNSESFRILGKDKILSLKYPIVPITQADFIRKKNAGELDPTILYTIMDADIEQGGGGNSAIITDGDGTLYLANNGKYKKIIDDTISDSSTSTYSTNKMKEVIASTVTDAIANASDTSVRIWQVSKLNVTSNQIINAFSTELNILSDKPIVVQCYKYVEGANDIVEIIKVFDNTDAENFVYNKDSVAFDDTEGMHIIDTYTLSVLLNSDGVYESEWIDTDAFEVLDRIEVI